MWQGGAACAKPGVDSRLFFPDPPSPAGRRSAALRRARQRAERAVAREFCAGCPVIAACAAHADEHQETGIWAGSLRRWGTGDDGWGYLVQPLIAHAPRRGAGRAPASDKAGVA